MGNSFGQFFKITTWGESHGGAVGVVVDGCPSQVKLDVNAIQNELDRRRPGQSHITTPRQESDQIEILSGLFEGQTTGTPISMLVWNKDARPSAYDHLKDVLAFHKDCTNEVKLAFRDLNVHTRSHYASFIKKAGRNIYPLLIASEYDYDNELGGGVGWTFSL